MVQVLQRLRVVRRPQSRQGRSGVISRCCALGELGEALTDDGVRVIERDDVGASCVAQDAELDAFLGVEVREEACHVSLK